VKKEAVWALGASQCVYWGIFYYTFGVLIVPMRQELQVSEAVLAGAFSLGLAVSALLATSFGRRLDEGHGWQLFRGGALVGASLLIAWSYVESPLGLYLVWTGLGVTLAASLYEAAFGLLTRAIAEPAARLNAMASVTILGGLASTLFLPLAAGGVTFFGWRATLRLLAALVLATAWLVERKASRELAQTSSLHPAEPEQIAGSPAGAGRLAVLTLSVPFVAATFAAMAAATLVVPTLVARGHTLAAASGILAALGVLQLPGRLWVWRRSLSPANLLVTPLLLQAVGLAVFGGLRSAWTAVLGVALFGLGAGIHTLARPWAVSVLYGVAASGAVNGRIARQQAIARAAGPFCAAAAASQIGATALFLALAGSLALLAPLSAKSARQTAAGGASRD
jgi:MFS family permease